METNDFLSRIEALETSEVINILSTLENGDLIIDSCINRDELNRVLLCNIESDNIDEIELIICESGK